MDTPVCSNFIPDAWRPNKCRVCFYMKDKHSTTGPSLPVESVAPPPIPVKRKSDNPTAIKQSSDCLSTDKDKNTTIVLPVPLPNSDRDDKISQIPTDPPAISQSANDAKIDCSKENLLHHINPVHLNQNKAKHSSADENVTNNQQEEHSPTPPTEITPSFPKQPCDYGNKCYRRNPEHLARYSHPSELANASTTGTREVTPFSRTPCKYGENCYRNNPEHLRTYLHPPKVTMKFALQEEKAEIEASQHRAEQELQQKQVEIEAMRQQLETAHLESTNESISVLQKEKQDLEGMIEILRGERKKTEMYLRQLEKALARESDHRERVEEENKHLLKIKLDSPSYWGANAFHEAYHEVEIPSKSPEFSLLQDLLNNTIELHDSKRGTIYGKDPTEFIVTKILRIHNRNLWHEYCFKKATIIAKNGNQLMHSSSSQYLNAHPPVVPLLNPNANEYWLFHGCERGIVPILACLGYDPRVSSLEGMFGGGFYLAENSSKSNQYIPCPGCGENSVFTGKGCRCVDQESLEFSMILYRAVLGDVYIVKEYDPQNFRAEKLWMRRPPYKENSTDLYDSVMGESVKHGGNQLKYREFILYESGQAYPEYVITYRRSAINARKPGDIQRIKDRCSNFLHNIINIKGK